MQKLLSLAHTHACLTMPCSNVHVWITLAHLCRPVLYTIFITHAKQLPTYLVCQTHLMANVRKTDLMSAWPALCWVRLCSRAACTNVAVSCTSWTAGVDASASKRRHDHSARHGLHVQMSQSPVTHRFHPEHHQCHPAHATHITPT